MLNILSSNMAMLLHVKLLLFFTQVRIIQGNLVNVALNKNASTTSGTLLKGYPSGAVDGNRETLKTPSSCFHSLRTPADWTVDLGQEYQLYRISVYIRETFLFRTANSVIYVDNDPSRVCYTFPSTISDNPTRLECNETARYVTIRNPGERGLHYDSLNICEVEIYACTDGSYGTNCEMNCLCSSCDRWTGVCSGDCHAGWQGLRCDTCARTHYGEDCARECGSRHCEGYSPCDSRTGRCDGGCQIRWIGSDCTDCAATLYGEDCARECAARHCEGNSSCDSRTGRCDGGCQIGWRGVACTELGIVVFVSAAFGAIIVIVISAVVCQRKRSSNSGSSPATTTTTVQVFAPQRDEENVYTSLDDGYEKCG